MGLFSQSQSSFTHTFDLFVLHNQVDEHNEGREFSLQLDRNKAYTESQRNGLIQFAKTLNEHPDMHVELYEHEGRTRIV